MSTRTRRTYRITRADELVPGDIIKITRTKVATVEHIDDQVRVTFTNGAEGVLWATDRFGVYR